MLHTLFFSHASTWLLFLALSALLVGSVLNMIIYRLPRMLDAEWRKECDIFLKRPLTPEKPVNLFFPRSFCPACKTTIPGWHNIPLLSYCLLRGQFAACQQAISPRYPLVELLCLILSLLAGFYFGPTLTLLFALLFIFITLCFCFWQLVV